MGADAVHGLSSTLITTTRISVERCGRCTIAIVFDEVKLCTTSSSTRVAIIANTAWKRNIEIVVYTAVRTAQVHVELHESTSKIVGCFGARPGTAVNSPTIIRPLWTSVIGNEVRRWVWTIGCTTSWSGGRGAGPNSATATTKTARAIVVPTRAA